MKAQPAVAAALREPPVLPGLRVLPVAVVEQRVLLAPLAQPAPLVTMERTERVEPPEPRDQPGPMASLVARAQ